MFEDFKASTAPRYMFWLARIFGKLIYNEGEYKFHQWRGKLWMTKGS